MKIDPPPMTTPHASDPQAASAPLVSRALITVIEGHRTGDRLSVAASSAGAAEHLALRSVRMESNRPGLIVSGRADLAAYSDVLRRMSLGETPAVDKVRVRAVIEFEDGAIEEVVIGTVAAEEPPAPQEASPAWLYDDPDFDLFLMDVLDRGEAVATDLPALNDQGDLMGWII